MSGVGKSGIAQRLDRLADAFESRGRDVRSNLLPGASAADLDAVEAELEVHLPAAFRGLYTWSAGPVDPDRDPALRFRDNTFLPLARVVACRREVIETYADPLRRSTLPDFYGVDLATTAPFAEFMGSTYLVGCGVHRPTPPLSPSRDRSLPRD
jgi:cell wall assembly regulator SMI1